MIELRCLIVEEVGPILFQAIFVAPGKWLPRNRSLCRVARLASPDGLWVILWEGSKSYNNL